MANNPYSAEVLQRRLSQKHPTSCIDLRNLPPQQQQEQQQEEEEEKKPEAKEEEIEPKQTQTQSTEKLQDIFKAEQPIYKR